MKFLFSFIGQLRNFVPQDLPIFAVLSAAALLVVVFQVFHKGMSLKDYLTGPTEEPANLYASWLLTGLGFALCWSVLLSHFVPVVPRAWQGWIAFSGLGFTPFGFVFWCVSGLMLMRSVLGFLFYHGTAHGPGWPRFVHQAQQFYTAYTLLLLPCLFIYFYVLDSPLSYFPYILVGLGGMELLKLVHYLIHDPQSLPPGWYHKMLYICTLQILPLFFFWKYIYW